MLILSRSLDEVIEIGDSIRITVIEIRRNVVRLGIDAPKEVTVNREEIAEAIRQAQQTRRDADEGDGSAPPEAP